jgi:Ribosomal protein S2
MEAYVYGRRKGKVRRDRNQSLEQRVRVLKRAETRRNQGRTRWRVGTTPELGRVRERRASKEAWAEGGAKRRVRKTRAWVSGCLTNPRAPVGLGGGEKKRNLGETRGGERPGLIVFRHPKDHGVGRKEARRAGIPTAGIVDSESSYVDRLRYPIPGNEASRAGQRRRTRRFRNRRRSTSAREADLAGEGKGKDAKETREV